MRHRHRPQLHRAEGASGRKSPARFVLEGGSRISQTADVMRVTEDAPRTRELLLRGHVWWVGTLIPLLVKFIPLRALIRLLTPPPHLLPYRRTGEERIVGWSGGGWRGRETCAAVPASARA